MLLPLPLFSTATSLQGSLHAVMSFSTQIDEGVTEEKINK